jgi:hypothetical protein
VSTDERLDTHEVDPRIFEQEHETEEEHLPHEPYRAVSALAVASLVCGVLSVLCAVWWFMGVAPLAGVVLGLVALRRIGRRPELFTGVEFAYAGIALSAVFWIAGWSWQYYLYRTQAPPGYLVMTYDMLHSKPGKPGNVIPPEAEDLVDRQVFVKGYMMPGRYQMNVKEFVMCRDNGVCSFCNPQPNLTDLIEVKLINGLETEYTTHLLGVGGKFKINKEAKPGQAVYQLEGDVLRWAP